MTASVTENSARRHRISPVPADSAVPDTDRPEFSRPRWSGPPGPVHPRNAPQADRGDTMGHAVPGRGVTARRGRSRPAQRLPRMRTSPSWWPAPPNDTARPMTAGEVAGRQPDAEPRLQALERRGPACAAPWNRPRYGGLVQRSARCPGPPCPGRPHSRSTVPSRPAGAAARAFDSRARQGSSPAAGMTSPLVEPLGAHRCGGPGPTRAARIQWAAANVGRAQSAKVVQAMSGWAACSAAMSTR